ncbi:MAG: nucleoside triphosphate pyrophosphohydrolase family protein [Thermoleophilia bacterium]|nr:nucleoside triphosphate pyrophosphohydrolase family protein [Thermoleophilia bacterium]
MNGVTPEHLTFSEYQLLSSETDLEPSESDPVIPLLGLAGEVGTLISEFKKMRRPDGVRYSGFEESVTTEMGDVLWYLAALARRMGVELGEVATQNLTKTRSRWLLDSNPTPAFFDKDLQADERLPRQFEVEFATFIGEGRTMSQMKIRGTEIGDPIDDNSHEADNYRFHDVFHLSYAAVLGWSPILRSLLRRKRKSVPELDHDEDGARAGITEEAAAALVFNLARSYDFFDGSDQVDGSILNAVKAVTSHLEVASRTHREWQEAILKGFEVWRQVSEQQGGLVAVDLEARTLSVVT